jgi:hypothetical protein
MNLVAGLGLVALGILAIAVRWQWIIWAVIFWIVVEGAFRKWVFNGIQAEIYLVKDALLLAAYIGFLASRVTPDNSNKHVLALRAWVLVTFFYFALEIINPNSPSLILSLVGLKNYMLYVPLAFVVPYLFASKDDLEDKLRRYAVLMIPLAGLGLVQFMFSPDHWLNAYLSYDDEHIAQGSMFGTEELVRARTIGTFSYIGGYVTFLTMMLYLGVALMANAKWKIKGNSLPFCLIVVTLGAMFTTGSRTPFYGLFLTAPLLFWIWGVRGLMRTQQLIRMVGFGTVVMVIVVFLAPAAIDAYGSRTGNYEETWSRIISPIYELYLALQTSPILGTGMASAHSSASSIMKTQEFWWLGGNVFELETARVLQETGILGFVLVYGFRIWLLALAIRLAMRFRTPLYVGLSSVIAGFFAQSLYLFVVNNPTAGIYYWFCVGLLFAMYRLESKALARPQGKAAPQMSGLVQSMR